MPIPKFPGNEQSRQQRIEDAKKIRAHQEEKEADLSDPDLRFQLGRVLGEGTFGQVFEAMNSITGEMVAVKRIELKSHKMKQQVLMAQTEIDLMRKLRHPNIVSLQGSVYDEGTFNIVMELVSGRSIADMLEAIGPFHENVVRKFTKQLLLALEYCHKLNCIHRDIKGKNILLTTTGQVRLCDFGSAKIREETIDKDAVSDTYSYTPLWVAPETLTTQLYNEKVDVWALGCVVIEMASGEEPWSEMKFKSAYQAIFHIGSSDQIPRIPDSLSAEGRDFCRRCLTRDPDARPSASEMLKHPFIAGVRGSAASTLSQTASLHGSAAEQMVQMSVVIDPRTKTVELSSTVRDSAAIVISVPPPPPPSQEQDAPPSPPLAFPCSAANAIQVTNEDRLVINSPARLGNSYGDSNRLNFIERTGTFNFAYTFDRRRASAADGGGGSRVFQYDGSSSCSDSSASPLSASINESLSSSVLTFIDMSYGSTTSTASDGSLKI